MSTLRDVETLLLKLSRAEKAQVLQWVVRDLGDAFEAQLLECYPSLRRDFAFQAAFFSASAGTSSRAERSLSSVRRLWTRIDRPGSSVFKCKTSRIGPSG